MKNPDSHEPKQTSTADHATNGDGRSRRLYSSTPRNTDSRKNAKTPSMANGCPTTAPVRRENSAQFVPNWNSIGIPVTTPAAKLIAKILVQNRAACAAPLSPENADFHV